MAGIDQTVLTDVYRGSGSALAIERIPVFALGVTPLISALLLVEVARLLSERFNDWVDAAPTNARRVNGYALIGALLIAAVQANSIANGLEAVDNVIAEPGLQFRLTVVVTLVASTALLAWLATFISANGLGSGIWVLLLVPHLASLPGSALPIFKEVYAKEVYAGIQPGTSIVVTLAYIIIALAAVMVLARVLTGLRVPLERALIWPLYMATWIMGALAAIALAVQSNLMGDAVFPFLTQGILPYTVASAVIVIAIISLAQWRQRLRPRPAAVAPSSPPIEAVEAMPIALTALILATLIVAPWIITAYFGIPRRIDGVSIVAMVVIALPIPDLLRGRQT